MQNKYFFGALMLICAVCAHVSLAQQYSVIPYRGEAGLPNTFTKSVAKDTLGFLWVGTDDHVVRFNGHTFKHFNQGFPNNYVKQVYLRRNGDLLVLTDMGLVQLIYNLDTVDIKLLVKGGTDSNDSSNNFIVYPKGLMEDQKGRLWISENRAVSYYYEGKLQRFFFSEADQSNSFYRSFCFTEFSDGSIIVVSQRGNGFWFDEKNKRFNPIKGLKTIPFPASLLYTGERSFWAATDRGIFSITLNADNSLKSNNQIVKDMNFSAAIQETAQSYIAGTWTEGIYRIRADKDKYLVTKIETPFKSASNVIKDRDGKIWCTADDGFYLLSPTVFQPYVPNMPQAYIQGAEYIHDKVLMFRGPIVYQGVYENGQFDIQQIWNNPQGKDILSIAPYNDAFVYATTAREVVFTDFGKKYNSVSIISSGATSEPYHIVSDKYGNVWTSQSGSNGILKVTPDGKFIMYGADKGVPKQFGNGVADKAGNYYGLAQGDSTYIFKYDHDNDKFINVSLPLKFDHNADFGINDAAASNDGFLYLATSDGLLKYTETGVERVDLGEYSRWNIKALAIDNNGEIWAANNAGLVHKTRNNFIVLKERHGLASNAISYRGLTIDAKNQVWAATSSGVSFCANTDLPVKTLAPVFSLVTVNGNTEFDAKRVGNGSYANLTFVCLAYPASNLLYQTRIISKDTTWSLPSARNELLLPDMEVGTYNVQIRAKQDGNYLWSEPSVYTFKVVPTWYQTWWARALFSIVTILAIFGIVRFYTYRLSRQKARLERIVQKRTEELTMVNKQLQQQTEEVRAANEEISSKNHLLESQYVQINQQNQKIEGSIRYAQTIQQAILPQNNDIASIFDFFTIYRPKDIVSGDFFWFTREYISDGRDYVFVSVVDCTGHGVPGAFMSLIAYSLLNEIVRVRRVYEPSEILAQLHLGVRHALRQDETDNNDGMDLVMCRLEKIEGKNNLAFAGAKNGLYVYREQNKELDYFGGESHSVGGFTSRHQKNEFQQHNTSIEKGDMLYLMSDGLVDQHDTLRKRFGSNRLRDILKQLATADMETQRTKLADALNNYMDKEDQRDDITVLGLRLK